MLTLASASGAQRWERLGPDGGMVVSLGAGSQGAVYLGTADGHVFASEDDTASWQLRGRVGSRLDAVVTRLVVDSGNANLVLAAVWYREAAEDGGVFRSDDGGRNWKASGLDGEAVRALEAAPSNRMEIVAGTRTGVFRSMDLGVTWKRISPEGDPELRNIDSVVIDPRDDKVIYAGTYHLPWRTKDGGKSWESIVAGIIDDSDIMSLRLDSTNSNRLYMSACSGIYRSDSQGSEWTKLQGIPYAARRTQTIVQDAHNPGIFYAGTTEGAWVTRDAGETWARTTPKDWVVNDILVLPARFKNAGRVIMGTESGVFISDDRGQTFTASDQGFTHVVIKQLAAGHHGSDQLLALVQRNGWELLESVDQAQTWNVIGLMAGGPGKTRLVPDQIEDAHGSPWGWMVRMADGHFWLRNQKTGAWSEWKPRLPAEPAPSQTPPGIRKSASLRAALKIGDAVTFSDVAALVSSSRGLLRCGETGTCTRLKAFSTSSMASALWVSANGHQIAVVEDGKLGLSSDGGENASWGDLPVPTSQVLWVNEVRSTSTSGIVLGTTGGLFLSADSGATWVEVREGIPTGRMETWLGAPTYWLVSERTGGLYLSRNQGRDWTRIDQDTVRGRFVGLVNVSDGVVLVGSQGEGLQRLAIAGK